MEKFSFLGGENGGKIKKWGIEVGGSRDGSKKLRVSKRVEAVRFDGFFFQSDMRDNCTIFGRFLSISAAAANGFFFLSTIEKPRSFRANYHH